MNFDYVPIHNRLGSPQPWTGLIEAPIDGWNPQGCKIRRRISINIFYKQYIIPFLVQLHGRYPASRPISPDTSGTVRRRHRAAPLRRPRGRGAVPDAARSRISLARCRVDGPPGGRRRSVAAVVPPPVTSGLGAVARVGTERRSSDRLVHASMPSASANGARCRS